MRPLQASALLAASLPAWSAQHYVFLNRDRERIAYEPFLRAAAIAGAQLKYTWKELEPAPDQYRFDDLRRDLANPAASGSSSNCRTCPSTPTS